MPTQLVNSPEQINGTFSGESVLGADFQITGSDGVYQDTGLSITLPVPGTYLIVGTIRGVLQGSTIGGFIVVKLFNSTDSTDVANSETLTIYSNNTGINQNSVSMTARFKVTASKTIKLYAFRTGGGVYTFSHISSNANGRTRLEYIGIGQT